MRYEIEGIIAHRIFAGDFLSLKDADLEDANIAVCEILALFQKLVESKRMNLSRVNPPYDTKLMENGYNLALDDLLSELK